MDIALILTTQIIKLFLILFAGFFLVKLKKLKATDSKCISSILVYLITPCMILHAFQIEYTPQVRDGLLFSMAAAVTAHIVFLVLTALLRKPLHLDTIEQLTAIYTNAGILVIPLIKAILGDTYVVYSCSFIIVQLILIWTHCCQKLCGSQKVQIKNLLLNINILSILVGALLFISRIPLPDLISDTMNMLADMMGPMGMLLAGMAISQASFKEVFAKPRNYMAVLLRLILYPLIILGIIKATNAASMIPDGKSILLTVFLACITPACATVTSLAQLYDKDGEHSGILYVLTTLCSILTMPVIIFLYEAWI